MVRVRIIVEGPTETSFTTGVLYHSLTRYNVFMQPTILDISGHRGGRVNYERLKKDVLTTLKQDKTAFCTTLVDLYGLGRGFPESRSSVHLSGAARANGIEQAILADMVEEAPSLDVARRFSPYIQVYEFEGLLFSDPAALARGMFRPEIELQLLNIRNSFVTPEEINDSPDTSPSKRLLALDRRYNKIISGTLAAEHMGLEVIRNNCPRFRLWSERLAALGKNADN